jgi:SP family sugar:H+ symporter-like MFS transporter
MTITLGTLAVIFGNAAINPATGNPSLSGSAGIIALLAANLYVVFFGFSWGLIVWVLLGEMFSDILQTLTKSGYSAGFPRITSRISWFFPCGVATLA